MDVVRTLRAVWKRVGEIDVLGIANVALIAQQRRDVTRLVVGRLCRLGHDVNDAASPSVRLGSTQPQGVDILTGDATNDVGAGDEDPPVRPKDDDIGECRAVRGTAGCRAEDHADLRNLSRGARHDGEDAADRVQALDAFGQPGAAGVPEADDGDTVGQRTLVRLDDDLAALRPHGAALDGRVAAEDDDGNTAHAPVRREHAAGVLGRERHEGARVDRRLQAQPRIAGIARPVWPGGASRLLHDGHEHAPHHEGDIVAAESERVVQCRNRAVRERPRLAAHDIEPNLIVGVLDVDGRRRKAFAQRQDHGDGLDRPGGAQQVAGHGLGRRDDEAGRGVLTQGSVDGGRFRHVTLRCGRGVSVDVDDVRRRQSRVFDRESHGPGRTCAHGVRLGDVECVGADPDAGYLGVGGCAATRRVLGGLEDYDSRALAEDETITALVVRPGCALGLVVALGQRHHRGERRERERMDRRLRAARDDDVSPAGADHLHAVGDGFRTRCAGADRRVDTCLGAELDAQGAGWTVGHQHRDRVR